MARVQCRGCGTQVSTKLIACPDCGTPVGYSGGTSVDYEQIRAAERAALEQKAVSAERDENAEEQKAAPSRASGEGRGYSGETGFGDIFNSFSREDDVAPGTSSYEYMHIWLKASTVERSGGFLGAGRKTEVSTYPYRSIQKQLNQLGQQGWELVSMEPHWYWERISISAAMQITHPVAITGWYCTFRRIK